MLLNRVDNLTVVLCPEAPLLVTHAARELVEHLSLLGITNEVSSSPVPGKKNILFRSDLADEGVLSAQGVVIRAIDGNSLLLGGKTPRGVLNATYVFLEQFLGFVWFNSEETYVPTTGEWDFSSLDYRFDPPFDLRSIACASTSNPTWSARRRLNLFADIPEIDWLENPGLEDASCFAGKHCHNVFKLLSLGYFGTKEDPYQPYENEALIRQLFQEHPEYFALINGKRRAYLSDGARPEESDQTGNISLTNPQVAALLVKGARVLLSHFPKAKFIGLSLRDNYDYCEEAMHQPGGMMKALTDLVNYFGREIEKTHPSVQIDFLAYHCTQRPPVDGRFHRNVSVRYCPIRVSQFHSFDESRHNLEGGMNYETPPSMSQPMRQIQRWRTISDSVIVWYYTLNLPYFHPQPSLRGHARTFRLLEAAGVRGVYIEDNDPMPTNCFNDLRVYLLTALLWDPRQNEGSLKKRFCEMYYGPAADAVLRYIELLHDEGSWDWESWLKPDGTSKWDTDAREISWDWFGDVPDVSYPMPHFYTNYTTRPPLSQEFFVKAEPLVREVRHQLEGSAAEAHLAEFLMSFYYGVLSRPCGMAELEDEAHEWFAPRYRKLLDECALKSSAFHGLDRLGLRWPEPVPIAALCEVDA